MQSMTELEQIARDVERNGYESIRLVVRYLEGGRLERREGFDVYTTGIPFFLLNGMLGAAIAEDDARHMATEEVESMRRTGLPFCWMVGPSVSPPDFGSHLESAGLRPIPMPGMWIPLDHLTPPPVPPGVEIREIIDPGTLESWAHALARGCGLPRDVTAPFAEAARRSGQGPASPLRPFGAILDGRVVGTSMLINDGSTAGVYNVSTAEEARRRGIGAAVTHAALRAGRDAGLRIGALFASTMGHSVYQKMGFQTCCTFTLYACDSSGGPTA